jgi:hypothetical protein
MEKDREMIQSLKKVNFVNFGDALQFCSFAHCPYNNIVIHLLFGFLRMYRTL